MPLSRRSFLATAAVSPLVSPSLGLPSADPSYAADPARFEPWIEVDSAALRANVAVLWELAGGRPIMAVVKNNGYGLGIRAVARPLDADPRVSGFGVVKVAEALALRDAGVRKPILLLALFDAADGEELVRRGITLSLGVPDIGARVAKATTGAGRSARGQFYIDTGMSRMGLPYHTALPILRDLSRQPRLEITGMMTELAEEPEFDAEQVRRLSTLAAEARAAGVTTGPLHAASSHAVFNRKETLLDAVRPGISLFGAYPTDDGSERSIAALTVAFRLKARVVRVEQLRSGDTVSYGRRFKAESPTWVATVPIGHADGYPRSAVRGGQMLIGGRPYPVVGAVSASHAIVNLGAATAVKVGDVAIVLGPDHAAIHPNTLAGTTGISVYDVLMHLSPSLPRIG
ncbi:MAG: alanine racemase [Gemmatimonadetes bacterium]|nr:alanine racemase [Gemmatimonadota bacterium]